jgi:hypothetical protein
MAGRELLEAGRGRQPPGSTGVYLKGVDLFGDLPGEDLADIAQIAHEVSLAPGLRKPEIAGGIVRVSCKRLRTENVAKRSR